MAAKIDLSQMPVVTDAASAGRFIRWCCRAIGPAFHPDASFRDYVEAGGRQTFSADEAARLDAQLAAAFGFLPDPYAIGLEEFEAREAGPGSPTARPAPVEGTTTQAKVLLARRTDIPDPVLSAFEAARMQLHLREARVMPGLAVVHLPVEDDPDLDSVAISGGHDHVITWLRKLVEMEVARCRYDIELPPDAREEADGDAWACWLSDRLDEPGIRLSVHICPDLGRWQAGLPSAC